MSEMVCFYVLVLIGFLDFCLFSGDNLYMYLNWFPGMTVTKAWKLPVPLIASLPPLWNPAVLEKKEDLVCVCMHSISILETEIAAAFCALSSLH